MCACARVCVLLVQWALQVAYAALTVQQLDKKIWLCELCVNLCTSTPVSHFSSIINYKKKNNATSADYFFTLSYNVNK